MAKTDQKELERRFEQIWEYQRTIIQIYKEEGLRNLAGLNMEYELNGRQVLAWFFQVVNKGENIFKKFRFHNWIDDISFCSDEILYFTANLYLYRPHLFNALENGIPFAGRVIYQHSQTIEVKRYYTFANSLFEKVYNFWDRIGDLIALYFPEIFSGDIYFGRTIERLPPEFQTSSNYLWLKAFKEKDFKEFNERRSRIVHKITLDTSAKYVHIFNNSNRSEIERLQYERDELPDYFKYHLDLALVGFEKAILLIEEISTAKNYYLLTDKKGRPAKINYSPLLT